MEYPPEETLEEAKKLARRRIEQDVDERKFASFRASGEIGISEVLMQEALSDVDYVGLYYNGDDLVCLAPDKEDEHASFSLVQDGSGGRISAQSFLKHMGRMPDEAERYAASHGGSYVFVYLGQPL